MNNSSICSHETLPPPHQRHKTTIKSLILSMFFIPTSITLVVLLILLVYNSFNIFYIHVPIPAPLNSSLQPSTVFPENIQEGARKLYSSSNYTHSHFVLTNVISQESNQLSSTLGISYTRKKRRKRKKKQFNKLSTSHKTTSKRFSQRVNEFFFSQSTTPCKVRFFMTWISSLESFSRREILTMESLFHSHMNACLLIVSTQMDSDKGLNILRPFIEQNLRVMAVAPDLEFLFKNTAAAAWFDKLKRGRVKPGEISLAQNLSNLLRLALLYKYGGIYMDTDFIILRSLTGLRNVIGAQNSDPRTQKWTRLNNAVMIFDKHHPLLEKFIEEFAMTFDGNKWGHNGPYLVSRVVKRVTINGTELNFTVVPPSAFYPVDWGRIKKMFRWSEEEEERLWIEGREDKIRKESYGVHLWNRQTRTLKVENGSLIARLMLNSCLFCNSTSLAFQI